MKSLTTNPYYVASNKPCVCIVVALSAEAQRLCEWFKLSRLNDPVMTVFSNQQQSIYLIVSDVGQLKVASSVAYFCGRYHASPILLNFGIAGSQVFSRGELVAINKIIGSQNYYPDFSWQQKILSTQCESRMKAQPDYPAEGVVDCEAAGFYVSANRFVVRENIRLLKLISDTNHQEMQQVDKSLVKHLIAQHKEALTQAMAECLALAESEVEVTNSDYHILMDRFHFSRYQSHQLFDLCRRYQALFQHSVLDKLQDSDNARDVLQTISEACQLAQINWELR